MICVCMHLFTSFSSASYFPEIPLILFLLIAIEKHILNTYEGKEVYDPMDNSKAKGIFIGQCHFN